MRYAERLRDAFPKATLVTVPDSGSFIPLDQPGELARLVRTSRVLGVTAV